MAVQHGDPLGKHVLLRSLSSYALLVVTESIGSHYSPIVFGTVWQ